MLHSSHHPHDRSGMEHGHLSLGPSAASGPADHFQAGGQGTDTLPFPEDLSTALRLKLAIISFSLGYEGARGLLFILGPGRISLILL